MVLDRGDRGLFSVWTCSFWVKKVLFPLAPVTATWIGDYLMNKRYAQNFGLSIYLHVINRRTCSVSKLITLRSSLRQWRCGSNLQRELWVSFKLEDFFSCSAPISFHAPKIRCVNKLTLCNYGGIVSSASPIVKVIAYYFAGESGNGNIFFNGNWHVQNKNGHQSPRSHTYALLLSTSWPTLFLVTNYL